MTDRPHADAAYADAAIARMPQIATEADLWRAVGAMEDRRRGMDPAASKRISEALRGRYAELTGRNLDGSPIQEIAVA